MLQNLIAEYYKKSHDLAQQIGYVGYTDVATKILSLTSGLMAIIERCESENKELKKEIESLKVRLNGR